MRMLTVSVYWMDGRSFVQWAVCWCMCVCECVESNWIELIFGVIKKEERNNKKKLTLSSKRRVCPFIRVCVCMCMWCAMFSMWQIEITMARRQKITCHLGHSYFLRGGDVSITTWAEVLVSLLILANESATGGALLEKENRSSRLAWNVPEFTFSKATRI